VRAAHGDGDADLADGEPAQAVNHGDVADRPAPADVGLDLGELLLGHAGISLIVEGGGDLAVGQVADGAEEGDDAAAVRPPDLLGQG
jgi:hypothetical protein